MRYSMATLSPVPLRHYNYATTITLLTRNHNLIKEMRQQLKLYENSPTKHEVWLRFQGYTRLIVLGGGGPPDGADAKKPA